LSRNIKMKQRLIQLILLLAGIVVFYGCSSEQADPQDFDREIAAHAENIGENDVVTKVFEQRKNGLYSIRVQVIKQGNIQETVHYFDDTNFSISVPVSATINVEAAKEDAPNANISIFSQKLEVARNAMLQTDYVTALEALNEALRIDSYNPQAHAMKGSILYAMGKQDLAKKEFDFVLKVDPDNSEVKKFRDFLESTNKKSPTVNFEGPAEQ